TMPLTTRCLVGTTLVGRRLSMNPASNVVTSLVTVQSGGAKISTPPQNANTSITAVSPSMRALVKSSLMPPMTALRSAPRKGRDTGRNSCAERIANARTNSAWSLVEALPKLVLLVDGPLLLVKALLLGLLGAVGL